MRKKQNAEIRKPEILENYYQVVIEDGLEGASIGKIAKRMGIHPSLIIHYFKTKNNMTIELVDLIVEKFEAPQFLQFNGLKDPGKRFQALMEVIFSKDWSKTVEISVFYAFYYLSFRKPKIRARFETMFKRFRNYLVEEFDRFKVEGIVTAKDTRKAADMVVTLMEGMEFHAAFLTEGAPFDEYAHYSKEIALSILCGEGEPGSGKIRRAGRPGR